VAGVYAELGSTVTFSGGVNTINAVSTYDRSYGLYADSGSQINFAGGTTSINATAGGLSAPAYGIYADKGSSVNEPSYINFASNLASGSITITANAATGNNQYGIYANDGVSHLQIDSVDVNQSAVDSELSRIVNFSTSSPSNGKAIDWVGTTSVTKNWN